MTDLEHFPFSHVSQVRAGTHAATIVKRRVTNDLVRGRHGQGSVWAHLEVLTACETPVTAAMESLSLIRSEIR